MNRWVDEDEVNHECHSAVCRRTGCSAPIIEGATELCQHHQAEQEMTRAEIALAGVSSPTPYR